MECRRHCKDKIYTLEQMKPEIQIFGEMPNLKDMFIVKDSKTVKCMECGRIYKLKWL